MERAALVDPAASVEPVLVSDAAAIADFPALTAWATGSFSRQEPEVRPGRGGPLGSARAGAAALVGGAAGQDALVQLSAAQAGGWRPRMVRRRCCLRGRGQAARSGLPNDTYVFSDVTGSETLRQGAPQLQLLWRELEAALWRGGQTTRACAPRRGPTRGSPSGRRRAGSGSPSTTTATPSTSSSSAGGGGLSSGATTRRCRGGHPARPRRPAY